MSIAETSLQPTTPVVSAVRPHHLREWEESAVAPTLARANLVSLRGQDVLQALAGHRLEQLSGHAQQYATGAVQGLLKPLEPVAAGGGWWCAGLDPLADWAPMEWGCFKPDQPRRDEARNRPRKYEHPIKVSTRSFWLRVPADVAAAIATRSGLDLPDVVAADETGAAGAFWRWLAVDPRLPLVITEGAKKAAALLSAGVPAVALPGVWNGAPKKADGCPALLPELAAVPLTDRPVAVLFDHPSVKGPRAAERLAARRLASLLRKAGAQVRVGVVPGPEKGVDDWFASGKTWNALEEHLQEPGPGAVVPRRPAAHVTAPADRYLSEVVSIPDSAPLVCLQAPMGAGKSVLIRQVVTEAMRDGTPVISITHRVNLGAATCAEWGLPWADEARPGQPLRHLGFGACVDSLCPESALRVNPDDWRDAVVIIDEAAQVLQAMLMGIGTAVAQRRVAVLATFVQLLANARQVIASDAQLPQFVVTALEAMTGARAYVIASERQPFANVPCRIYEDRKAAQAQLAVVLANLQARVWISTTAARAGQKNSTIAIEKWVQQYRPDLKVLRIDSETMADPDHDASRFAENPEAIAQQYDVIVCSPAVAAGLSVPATVPFDAVFGFSGGVVPVADAVQALARVRYSCPRYVYAPERAPGDELRVGSGDFQREKVLRHCGDAAARIVSQLVAAGVDLEAPARCSLLDLWGDYAATQNGQRLAYRETMAAFLEVEGLAIKMVGEGASADPVLAERVNCDLKVIADADKLEFEQAVIAAPLPGPEVAQELQKKRRLTREEAVIVRRLEIATRWGEDAEPTPELLEADDEGLSHKLMMGWLLRTPDARQKAIDGDVAIARRQLRNRKAWEPDLCRENLGQRLDAIEALGLPRWMARTDTFTADDPQLVKLQAIATSAASSVTQVLGIRPGADGVRTLRKLLKQVGYQLVSDRCRVGSDNPEGDNRQRVYQVEQFAIPAGVNPVGLEQAWTRWLEARIGAATPEGPPRAAVPEIPLLRDTGMEKTGTGTEPPAPMRRMP